MKKLTIGVFLIALILFTYYFTSKSTLISDDKVVAQKEILTESSHNKANVKANVVENQYEKDNIIEKSKNSLLSNQHSEDPFIEYMVLSQTHHACFLHFSMKKVKQSTSNMKNFYSEKQMKYFQSAENDCEEINKDHPEFYLELNPLKRPDMNEFAQESPMSKYLNKGFLNAPHQETEEIFELATKVNPNLIPVLLNKSFSYRLEVIEPHIRELIQSNDKSYSKKVSTWALNLMTCELGAYCGRLSQIMSTMCQIEENFCVNDFIELYNTRLTPGVKADIQIALRYYKNLYKVQ